MKDCVTRSRRPGRAFAGAGLPALLLAGTLVSGCVTRGTHQEVVDERDRLRARVEKLEVSAESLGSERVRLLDEMEDLRQQREELDANLRVLKRAEAELAENLARREEELAVHRSELSKLRGTYEGLVQDLEQEVASGQIQIEQLRSGVRVNLTQDVLFASGEARLNAAGRSVVAKVAHRLAEVPNRVEVQGHTDDVPISTPRFPSNWELAAARAAEVVRLLEGSGVDASRLTAVSYGEHHPVASNDTESGRRKNRRIEIRLQPAPPSAETAATP